MRSLKNLHSTELLLQAKKTALEERRLGIELLHYLQEIDRRRLFAPRFSSLHEYVVRELGYSDGAAHRRISAMRLMRDVPEVEEKLSAGSLTLSTASQVQNFLVTEKRSCGSSYSPAEKRELISSLENKSSRQTESLLAARSPRTAALMRERPRSIDGENIQITLTLSASLQAKLERLKNLMSHQHPHPSLSEQLELLADLALRKLDPAREPGVRTPSSRPAAPVARRNSNFRTEAAPVVRPNSNSGAEAAPVARPNSCSGAEAAPDERPNITDCP